MNHTEIARAEFDAFVRGGPLPLVVAGEYERPPLGSASRVEPPKLVKHTVWVTTRDGVAHDFSILAVPTSAHDEARIQARARYGRGLHIVVRAA